MRPLRAGGRPVFLWEAFGGGCSGGGGAIKTAEVTLVPLPPLADTVLNRGSGECSESAKSSSQLSEQNSIVMEQKIPSSRSRPDRRFLALASARSRSR